MKLTEAFNQLEETLVRNVANHIIQYEFHCQATEEELIAFYGGGYTNRESLLDDTRKRLVADQKVLQFLINQKEYLIENYGEKDPAGDIGLTLQRATGADPESPVEPTDAGEDGSEPDPESDVRSGDSPDESDHGAEPEGGNKGSAGDRGAAA